MSMNIIYKKIPILFSLRKSVRFYRGQYIRLKKRTKELEEMYYTNNTVESNVFDKKRRKCIVMIDGRFPHGGLTDRLRGCLSIFSFCKDCNIPFFINFVYPFNLIEYLVPNKYDWTIKPEDISYDRKLSQPLVLDCFDAIGESIYDKYLLKKKMNNSMLDIHIYSNAHFCSNHYAKLFNELFKPSQELQSLIDFHINAIGSKYVSATFRFQQLLGDFKEGDPNIYHILDDISKKQLIERCIDELLSSLKKLPLSYKMLVTSDSITFLEKVAKIERVYVVPGKVAHMNYTASDNKIFMKSFVDLFLLMNAETIMLYQTGEMYNSGFPRFAARLSKHKFIHHKF